MCLYPAVTKYRLGCSFEDSTIYPSPTQHSPSPTPNPHFTFYSQWTLKNSTVIKRQLPCLPSPPLFLFLSSFLIYLFFVQLFLFFPLPSFRCIYLLPSHIVSFFLSFFLSLFLSFYLSFWMNFKTLLPNEKQYQGRKRFRT